MLVDKPDKNKASIKTCSLILCFVLYDVLKCKKANIYTQCKHASTI